MDLYPIMFDAQLVIIVLTLVLIAFDGKIAALEKKVIRRFRRKKTGIRCTDGKVVGWREQ